MIPFLIIYFIMSIFFFCLTLHVCIEEETFERKKKKVLPLTIIVGLFWPLAIVIFLFIVGGSSIIESIEELE